VSSHDDAVRRLARVADEQVARATGAEAREALLERIVAMPVPPVPSPRRRRRAQLVAGVTGVTLAASGTIGWAIVRAGDPRDTTSLQCQIGGSASIITAVSGDPVADCAAQWTRDLGVAAPPLVAYDNGHGGILVQPAADPAPSGGTPLPAGQGQNVALIDLQESLDDYVAGLGSRCFTQAEAVAFARAEVARTGLVGWTVTPRDAGRCTDAGSADPVTRTVWLLARGTDPADEQGGHVALAARLREIARQCRPLAATRALVDKAVRDLGMTGATQVTEVPTGTRCTTIRERVGGAVDVTLRGPA
jgi:hypothetical protein